MNKIELVRNIIYSILSVQDKIEDLYLYKNFLSFAQKDLDFPFDEHRKIINFIASYVSKYDTVPSIPATYDYFGTDLECQEELVKLSGYNSEKPNNKLKIPYRATNFSKLLDDLILDQTATNIVNTLKNVDKIIKSGLEVKVNKRSSFYKGPIDAVEYAYEYLNKAISLIEEKPEFNQETLLADIAKYQQQINNKCRIPFLCTGFDYFDNNCHGIYPKAFVIVCAYTGELKSTIALNMMYNQVVYQKANIEYICLEMTEVEMQSRFISIHSADTEFWEYDCIKLKVDDIIQHINMLKPFTGDKLNRFNEVVQSLQNIGAYFHFQENDKDFTVSSIQKHCRKVELDKSIELDAVYIDHGELITPSMDTRNDPYTVKVSNTLMSLRKLSLNFAKKRGIRVIVPYQTSREGYSRAQDTRSNGAEGVYDLNALSWSSEAAMECSSISSREGEGMNLRVAQQRTSGCGADSGGGDELWAMTVLSST
jgi:replicative DNA helicase